MLAMTCSAPPAVCGDGQIAGSEACDDGLPPASGDGQRDVCDRERLDVLRRPVDVFYGLWRWREPPAPSSAMTATW